MKKRKKFCRISSTPGAEDYNKATWREEKIKIVDKIRVVSYVDYLNKFNAVFNIDQLNDEDIYTPYPPDLKVGSLYYFKNTQRHVFPWEFDDRYILARLYRVFPSSVSDMGDPWIPKSGGHVTAFTAVYWFYVVDVFDNEKDCLRATVLKGFRDVIDDNEYFDKIPEINEIYHWDNGIISNSKVRAWHKFDKNPDNWDKFKLFTDTVVDKTFSIQKMLKRGHENPER